MTTGCTGSPGINAPLWKRARQSPFVVVPSVFVSESRDDKSYQDTQVVEATQDRGIDA